jgi:pyruvate dehydrogenase E1 component beta subunit
MSLKQPDPVIFIEHKGLYVRKGELDVTKPDAPWGQSVIRREGTDVTIVTYSKMVFESLAAADTLRQNGVSAEVVDIRCLNPLDDETFVRSVMKTGRAMVVTEAVMTSGFAAELSARISERCFDYLEEPVIRVAGEDIPIPVSPALERGAVPSAQLIAESGLWLVKRIAPTWAA